MRALFLVVACFLLTTAVRADGPADNNRETVRRLPKLGIEVPAEKRAELEAGLTKLQASIDELGKKKDPKTVELVPDVRVFHKAVHDALKYQEFHDPKELDEATKQLTIGQQRADALLKGEAPWTTQAGLVVRGYVSKIDGSVQPYGVVVPETYTDKTPVGYRCDVWLHGRGETMTELNFIKDRLNNPGTFTPARTLVLHPYGRWNNAFKFAGEVDVFEALASAKKRYAIDDDRVSIRGFSMGGAGAWHLAVHYPDQWFAANPGAGFSETPQFLKVFQKEDLSGKPWWEERLWKLYDCTSTPGNISNVPTIAYSGALDPQKQAADEMAIALGRGNIELTHIIGPETKHSYHADAKADVERRLATLANDGRQDLTSIYFECITLRYNQCGPVSIDGITEHFNGDGCASIALSSSADGATVVTPKGVTAFTLARGPESPSRAASTASGQELTIRIVDRRQVGGDVEVNNYNFGWPASSDGSFRFSFTAKDGKWEVASRDPKGLRKKHGLQGPIDDAFMESFIMVRPTGKAAHEAVEKWTTSECDRAVEQWRRHFRGKARVKDDKDIADEDIKQHNLILWGDPSSNAVLAKLVDKLPITWDKDKIHVEEHGDYVADLHALIAIYPNPLNPEKYIVLNSGFTFREYAHLNNARQVPMLPDWAVVDLSTPPGPIWPGKIVAADFFDEQWQLKKSQQ